jgi:hypothetical protein
MWLTQDVLIEQWKRQDAQRTRAHLPPSIQVTKGLMYVLHRRQRTMPPESRPMMGRSCGSAMGCTMAPKGSWNRVRMACTGHIMFDLAGAVSSHQGPLQSYTVAGPPLAIGLLELVQVRAPTYIAIQTDPRPLHV